jgi:hypothetical protein
MAAPAAARCDGGSDCSVRISTTTSKATRHRVGQSEEVRDLVVHGRARDALEYVVVDGLGAPAEARAAVRAAGGMIVKENREIGVATVRTRSRGFAARADRSRARRRYPACSADPARAGEQVRHAPVRIRPTSTNTGMERTSRA